MEYERKGYYRVDVFDENNKLIDTRHNVIAWNRREAYYDSMSKMKPHRFWDSTRTCDAEDWAGNKINI